MRKRVFERELENRIFSYVLAFFIGLEVVAMFYPASLLSTLTEGQAPAPTTFPRNETFYVIGYASPIWQSWNPFWQGDWGTFGFMYEPLWIADVLNGSFYTWLASSLPSIKVVNTTNATAWLLSQRGPGVTMNYTAVKLAGSLTKYVATVTITLRQGEYWWNGQPLNASDVNFTAWYVTTHPATGLSYVTGGMLGTDVINSTTIVFYWNVTWPHGQLDQNIYTDILNNFASLPIIYPPQWDNVSNIVGYTNANPMASGMYKPLLVNEQEEVLVRVDNWWGAKYFGLPGPKYIVAWTETSNSLAIELIERGEADFGERGIYIVKYLQTHYPWFHVWSDTPPYYPPSGGWYLAMNDKVFPLNLSTFRTAIALAMNYTAMQVALNWTLPVATNPFAWPAPFPNMSIAKQLLPPAQLQHYNPNVYFPYYTQYINWTLVKEYGWWWNNYNLTLARQLLQQLASQGYIKIAPDGTVEFPNGTPITFTIQTVNGWSDTMEIDYLIAQDLQQIGIRVIPYFPTFNTWYNELMEGQGWTLSWWWFYAPGASTNPVGSMNYFWQATFYNLSARGNYSYNGVADFPTPPYILNITQHKIYTVAYNNYSGIMYYYNILEKYFLQEVPYIPWSVSGPYWYFYSTQYWVGFPNASNPYIMPPYSALYQAVMLIHLRPAQSPTSSSTVTSSTQTSTSSMQTQTTTSSVTTSTQTTTSSVTTSTPVTSSTQTSTSSMQTQTTTSSVTTSSSNSMTLIAIVVIVVIVVALIVAYLVLRRR